MKKNKSLIVLLVCLCLVPKMYGITVPDSALYMGQTLPGDTPVIFAPGLVSLTDRPEKVISFSDNGDEVFFVMNKYPDCRILYSHYTDTGWTVPATAPFQDNILCDEPFFSSDGSRVYYYRMVGGKAIIGYSEKEADAWQAFVSAGSTLNNTNEQYHPCIVADSSIYFANGPGSVCRSQYTDGSYENRVVLPYPINGAETGSNWGDAYVSPDESYMIIHSTRTGGYGGVDLYISYKKEDGGWTNPKNLGETINTAADEFDGDISPDGKYLFYAKNQDDIFWVQAWFIDSLRHTNFIPYYLPNSIQDKDLIQHDIFDFAIPANAFTDDDGDSTLTYSATLSDNSDLPYWLEFDTLSAVFMGIAEETGTFRIKITATDESGAAATAQFNLTVNEGGGLSDGDCLKDVRIYPNPVSEKLYLSSENIVYNTITVNVIDLGGELVKTAVFQHNSTFCIDLKDVQKGVYIVEINIDGSLIHKKIFHL